MLVKRKWKSDLVHKTSSNRFLILHPVYATQQGGAGDARINVRGFNPRNVAVMINGVSE